MWGWMSLAITLGTIGHLMASFIVILGALCLLHVVWGAHNSIVYLGIAMFACGILRGVFRYGEQACNHFIAFTLLAHIRNAIFEKLSLLAPAKLDGKDKGNLISMITSDIELLEVFFAHTISPIMIAIAYSLIMLVILFNISPIAAIWAFFAYSMIGLVFPMYNSRKGQNNGNAYRNVFGDMNSFVLESLRGLRELLGFNQGEKRLLIMEERGIELEDLKTGLVKHESANAALSDSFILMADAIMLIVLVFLKNQGVVDGFGVVLGIVVFMSSFGPVLALSAVSGNLWHTLACGRRVLDLLDEEPSIKEVMNGEDVECSKAQMEKVDFTYEEEQILKNFSLSLEKGETIGLWGKSGSGKSTILKLLMRFYDPNSGSISMNGKNLKEINTASLRDNQAYMTQETVLFHDSIYENLVMGRKDVSMEMVEEACKKAAIHDMISSLPQGYNTMVGELGSSLSGGEKQRIGLARVFLHGANMLLLDEPTSNLDSLNEAMILKSLKEFSKENTVILVSHRKSTLNIADRVIQMETFRHS